MFSRNVFTRLTRDQRGSSMVEYVIVVGVVSLFCLAAFRQLGARLSDKVYEKAAILLTL